ncbi:MAG: GNAT family N-acetyltransferase [Formivibrio sp.]|nr:GNAT family N-acetyltransferase [Formivibrio sp.]
MAFDIRTIDTTYPRPASLFELIRDVYTTSDHMSESFSEKYHDVSVLTAEVADITNRPGAVFLVAEAEKKPLGYLIVKPRHQTKLRHTADLHMGIHSCARGQGLGGTLIEKALTQLELAGGVEIVYLMVRADNLSAIALYSRMGFDSIATLKKDTKVNGVYFDGILMRRFIHPQKAQTGEQ